MSLRLLLPSGSDFTRVVRVCGSKAAKADAGGFGAGVG